MVRWALVSLTLVVLAGGRAAADEIKSGPPVGTGATRFAADFLNGTHAGKSRCPV